MFESRPNTIGRGPAHVGATAAIALGFTKPFLAARTAIVAVWPPPKTISHYLIWLNKMLEHNCQHLLITIRHILYSFHQVHTQVTNRS